MAGPSPLPTLRLLVERTVTVRDIVREPLWTVKPHQRANEAGAELAARGFDVAGLAEDPVSRYVTREALEMRAGKVSGAAQRILASDVVSADLPLSDLIRVLEQRPFVFVLDRDPVRWVVTCADLQAPAVGMVVLAYLVALETGLASLVTDEWGEGWFDQLPPNRQERAREVFAQREAFNAETGLADCLNFGDWLYLAGRSPAVLERLGYTSRKAYAKDTGSFSELRNALAHGGTILDGTSPAQAIQRFVRVRRFADAVWDVAEQHHERWDQYGATILSVRGRRQRLNGRGACQRLPWAAPLHVLTAWNPGSVIRPEKPNRAANDQLEEVLRARDLEPVPVVGASSDGRWKEESLLVGGLHRSEAAELGERFGQIAVFELTDDELLVVRCPDGEVIRAVSRRPPTPRASSKGSG